MPGVGDPPAPLAVRAGGLYSWKSGAFLSWSLVQLTLSLTMVGSSLRLTMAVLPPAPVLLPVSAGTGWNALISMATLFSPIPRNPPTPTTSPRILPFLSNSMSLTLPMCALSGPRTSVPLNLENTHWPVLCAAMNFAVSCGMASAFGAVAAGGFGDISACARAPEIISALTAAEIIRVLSICGLRSSLFRQGKEAFLARDNSRAQPCVPCIGNLACAAAKGFCALQTRWTARIGEGHGLHRRGAERGRTVSQHGSSSRGGDAQALTTA